MGKFLPLGGTRSHRATPNAKRGDHFLQADVSVTESPCRNLAYFRVVDRLLLHAESEACSCADFLHVDFLEPDALKAGAFKRSETAA